MNAPTKEFSNELMRQTLPLVNKHGSDFGPQSYALWYNFARAANRELYIELNQIVVAEERLSTEETERLFQRFIIDDEVAAMLKLRGAVGDVMEQLTATNADALDSTRAFTDNLNAASERLKKAGEGSELTDVLLEEVQVVTAAMDQVNLRLDQSMAEVAVLRRQLEEVRRDALTDPLTQLCNRRALDAALAEQCVEPARGQFSSSIVLVDIDHFKKLNDTAGHLYGDKVLRALGELLKSNVKGQDVAARFGGEEFAVLLPNTSLEGAMVVAETIRRKVMDLRIARSNDEPPPKLTVSCGVAYFNPSETVLDFVERADKALYDAKESGRNRTAVARAR